MTTLQQFGSRIGKNKQFGALEKFGDRLEKVSLATLQKFG